MLGSALGADVAAASEAPGDELSDFEASAVEEALAHYGWTRDPAPDGKRIEDVRVYAIEVFDERDPVPDFLNVFHATSRPRVIERELLIGEGDVYDSSLVHESERNLRLLPQLSLVLLVPARGSAPDRVRLVAIVKDVWSLRLNTNFGAGAGALDFLLINPAEENLFGTHKSIGLLYLLQRDSQSFGARYVDRRLGGSRLFLSLQSTLAFNRDTGHGEGSTGLFIFERPLFSLRSDWGYSSRVAWRQEVTRRYDGGSIRTFDYVSPDGVVEQLPEVYDTDRLAGEYWGVRSWGIHVKHDLMFGLEADRRRYRRPSLTEFTPEAVAAFDRDIMPVSDVLIGPFVQLRSYGTRFLRTLDLETLGLQEDYRLGHEVVLRVSGSSRDIGSTRDTCSVMAEVAYTEAWSDGLIRAIVTSDITLGNDGKDDALLRTRARIATPTLPVGRLHLDGLYATRYRDYLNVPPFALGGNNRLRGYRLDEFQGRDVLVGNAEFRSRSIDVLSAQLGGAVFYDVGNASDALALTGLQQGAGVGVRLLFPQAERIVLRVDWALPLSRPDDPFPGTFFATFGQAFGMPLLVQPSVTTSVSLLDASTL